MPPKNDDVKALIIETLKDLPPEELKALLFGAGVIPTTAGLTPEHLQVIMGSMTAASATAMKESLRSTRKENPFYPEKSVFHPNGIYNDAGESQPPKVKFRRPTKHNGVRLGGELETEEEIQLFNSFTDSKTARDGRWSLEIVNKGTSKEMCLLTTPSLTADDRMENALPLPLILRELLGGPDAVNPATMASQIEKLQKANDELARKFAELEGKQQPAAV